MIKKNRLAIIRDILTIYQKYDEREIRGAIEAIRRGDALEDLLVLTDLSRNIVENTPNAKRVRGGRSAKPRNSKDRFNEFLETLESNTEEHYGHIATLIKAIAKRQVLQSVGSLREFTESIDITIPTSKADRHAVAKKVGEALIQRSPRELFEIIEMATRIGGEKSSLREWSDIIVKK